MPRPTPRRRQNPQPAAPPPEPEAPASFDPADIIAGVALFISIPVLTYVFLALVGKPVSGQGGGGIQDEMRAREALESRPPPPIQEKEVELRLAYAGRLLERNYPAYRKRFDEEGPTRERHRWWERAKTVLKAAKDILLDLEKEIPKNPEFAGASARLHQVRTRLDRIAQDEHDLDKSSLFLDD